MYEYARIAQRQHPLMRGAPSFDDFVRRIHRDHTNGSLAPFFSPQVRYLRNSSGSIIVSRLLHTERLAAEWKQLRLSARKAKGRAMKPVPLGEMARRRPREKRTRVCAYYARPETLRFAREVYAEDMAFFRAPQC